MKEVRAREKSGRKGRREEGRENKELVRRRKIREKERMEE